MYYVCIIEGLHIYLARVQQYYHPPYLPMRQDYMWGGCWIIYYRWLQGAQRQGTAFPSIDRVHGHPQGSTHITRGLICSALFPLDAKKRRIVSTAP